MMASGWSSAGKGLPGSFRESLRSCWWCQGRDPSRCRMYGSDTISCTDPAVAVVPSCSRSKTNWILLAIPALLAALLAFAISMGAACTYRSGLTGSNLFCKWYPMVIGSKLEEVVEHVPFIIAYSIILLQSPAIDRWILRQDHGKVQRYIEP